MILKNWKRKTSKSQLTSSQVASLANHTVLQANKKGLTTIDISGQICLESLKKSNPPSLLQKMSEELLTSKTAWYSKQCALTWKVKASKSNRLLFQLQASVRPIKEKESGLWATPNTMDHLPPRSEEGTKKLMQGHRKGRTKPSNLREQVDPATMRLWRTPDAHCDRGASSEKRMKMKIDKKMPISLNDQVAHPNIMWPTPQARDWKGSSGRSYKGQEKDLPTAVRNKPGGSLNPTWVEWLMGYPGGYTDLKDWETLSSRKSQKK